jgi:hypothetical protein
MKSWIKPLFIIAGFYDAVVAIAFLCFAGPLFKWFGVIPPNHLGYVKFPALLLLIFAAMFFRIAGDPVKNRDLIPYGIALKIAYCGTVFWYQLTQGVPSMWIPWAWADLAFLVLFVIAWKSTAPGRT